MKANLTLICSATLVLLLSTLNCQVSTCWAQGTAFTYQGRLNAGTNAANGIFDLTFTLFNTNLTGAALAGPVTNSAMTVSNGLFTTTIDFGSVFDGNPRWLEIGVRTNGAITFSTLAPRQQLTPTPYAILANTASNLAGSLPASQISGTLAPANIAPGSITSVMLAPGAVSTLGAPDGSPTNAVQVDNNGLVGIGTTTPAAGLQITSGASIPTLSILFEVASSVNGWPNFNYPESSAINGKSALLAVGSYTGVTIASIADPSNPSVLSEIAGSSPAYNNLRNVEGVAWAGSNLVAGAYGYLGSIPSTVFIIGCTNPANPVKLAAMTNGIGGWNHLDQIYGIAVFSNLLAIASYGSNAVTLADISNPSAPILRSTILNGVNGFTNLGGVITVALSHNLLAIGAVSSNAVTLVDVSNPATPVKRAELVNGAGGYTNLSGVYSVALSESGNLLAIAASGSNAVTLVNVSNPANPVKLAELRDGVGGYQINGASSVALSSNRLAIANGNASTGNYTVTVVDVSIPANPVLVDTAIDGLNGVDYLWGVQALSIAGTNVVAGGSGNFLQYGLSVFGIGSVSAGLESANWVGIGTTHPRAALDVVGNVLVENATLFEVNAQRVALGFHSAASGIGSAALGYACTADGNYSTALGDNTTASGIGSTAMGALTTASGAYATVPGGWDNTAAGAYSFAAGTQARAYHDGTFVWADSQGVDFASTSSNQFLIRAQGGVGIGNNSPKAPLHVTGGGDAGMNGGGNIISGLVSGQNLVIDNNEIISRNNSLASDLILNLGSGNVGIGRNPTTNRLEVGGDASKATAGNWLANSDARIKTGVRTVTNALDKLSRVRLVQFRYTDDYRAGHPGVEDRDYLNVVAQEFQKVFPEDVKRSGEKLPSGEDILQVDTYPLTIYSAAAIQELNQKLEAQAREKDVHIRTLEKEVWELKQAVKRLSDRRDL
jgi:hypothetical protein